MQREIVAYLKAISQHWLSLLAGPVATLALSFAPGIRGSNVQPWVWVLAMLAGVPIAGFLAWAEGYRKLTVMEADAPRFISCLIAPVSIDNSVHVTVRISNPGPAIDLVDDWFMEIISQDGRRFESGSFSRHLDIRKSDLSLRLQAGSVEDRTLDFSFGPRGTYDPATGRWLLPSEQIVLPSLDGARITVTVSDARSRELKVEREIPALRRPL